MCFDLELPVLCIGRKLWNISGRSYGFLKITTNNQVRMFLSHHTKKAFPKFQMNLGSRQLQAGVSLTMPTFQKNSNSDLTWVLWGRKQGISASWWLSHPHSQIFPQRGGFWRDPENIPTGFGFHSFQTLAFNWRCTRRGKAYWKVTSELQFYLPAFYLPPIENHILTLGCICQASYPIGRWLLAKLALTFL